jgi:hypothetical protein
VRGLDLLIVGQFGAANLTNDDGNRLRDFLAADVKRGARMVDLYTKLVLTVIAASLTGILVQNSIKSARGDVPCPFQLLQSLHLTGCGVTARKDFL